jgi:peptidoglycan/xylan/chitin deacetylase (PgdA/CDA1 family)
VHIYEEILRNAVVVQALTGVWPHFLRPPGGQSNPRVLEAAAACGMAGAFWSVDVLKAEDSGSSDNVVNYVLKHVHSGSIILMHNGAFATTQAIPKLTSELRARGYKLVTLLTLAKDASPAPG